MDLLLGADVFGRVMRHGQRIGSPGSPSAFDTLFGWVLAGEVGMKQPTAGAMVHCATITTEDLLRKFWEVKTYDSKQSPLTVEQKILVQDFNERHS